MSRTRQAEELLSIAFMLLAFRNAGATLTTSVRKWARSILWRNGEPEP